MPKIRKNEYRDIEKRREQWRRAANGKCAYCLTSIEKRYHIDHVIPLTRGGSNWPMNLALACVRCNTSKGNRLNWKFANVA